MAVNLRSGGTRGTIGAFVDRCLSHEPDVLALSEFRAGATGDLLRERLAAADYSHQGGSLEHRGNGVLVASRRAFESLGNPFGLGEDEYPNAIVEGAFGKLRVYAVYLPGQDRKRPHLRCFIAEAKRANERGEAAIAIGDFNSGRNATDIELNLGKKRLVDEFSTADLYAELERHWTEVWLYEHPGKSEFSWYPFRKEPPAQRRNGWRIDKAFVSNALLPHLERAEYDHGFRTNGLTDHSALVVDLAVSRRLDSGVEAAVGGAKAVPR